MKVLCAGLAVCDILVKPITPDCFIRDTTHVDLLTMAGGGDAYNVALNLAALDVPVSLNTRIGNDELGSILLNKLNQSGVYTGNIVIYDDMPTSSSIVLIKPDGERSFLAFRGACHSFISEDVTDEQLDNNNVFYLGSAFGLPKMDKINIFYLFKRAHEHKMTTVLDVTSDLCCEQLEILKPVFQYLSLFMPSYDQAKGLTGYKDPKKAAQIFHSMGCETVVIKLGAEGSLVLSNDKCKRIPAYKTIAIDTTGAGDAFVSGYIAALVRGMPPNLCAKFGNAAGSICAGKIGASGTLSNFSELQQVVGL